VMVYIQREVDFILSFREKNKEDIKDVWLGWITWS
jgi:hypothetical protein